MMAEVNNLESSKEQSINTNEESLVQVKKHKEKKVSYSAKNKERDEMKLIKDKFDEEIKVEGTVIKRVAEKKKRISAEGKKKGVTKQKRKPDRYNKATKLSPALSELVGAKELPKQKAIERIWTIIKERQLFDPLNRRFAICDKPLYNVIGRQRFCTFDMMKYLKNHFLD